MSEQFWAIYDGRLPGFIVGTGLRKTDTIRKYIEDMEGIPQYDGGLSKMSAEQKAAWKKREVQGVKCVRVRLQPIDAHGYDINP